MLHHYALNRIAVIVLAIIVAVFAVAAATPVGPLSELIER